MCKDIFSKNNNVAAKREASEGKKNNYRTTCMERLGKRKDDIINN